MSHLKNNYMIYIGALLLAALPFIHDKSSIVQPMGINPFESPNQVAIERFMSGVLIILTVIIWREFARETNSR